MKITFWGTSHGVPSVERHCTATLIQCGDCAYLIDGGAPVADLMIRYGVPYSQLKSIFVTHMHSDHTFGIPHLCSLANWYFRDASFDVYLPEQAGIEAFRAMLLVGDKKLDDARIRLKNTVFGTFYDDGILRVTAIPTGHMEEEYPSCAYMIEGEGKRVIFTGDLRPDVADFPAVAETMPTDAVVCEMAHFGPEQIQPHMERCLTKYFFFHHIYGMEAALAAEITWRETMPFSVHLVRDGDAWEV